MIRFAQHERRVRGWRKNRFRRPRDVRTGAIATCGGERPRMDECQQDKGDGGVETAGDESEAKAM